MTTVLSQCLRGTWTVSHTFLKRILIKDHFLRAMGSGNSKSASKSSATSGTTDQGGHENAKNYQDKNKSGGSSSKAEPPSSPTDKPIAPFVPSDPGAVVEAVICDFDALNDGEMREVEVSKKCKALLVRENGEYSAVGAKCTHYGAPLVKGALFNGRVRCPWHGACFNVKTGDIEDFPGLDSLPKFDVEVKNGKVIIKTTQKMLESNKRVKYMSCHSPDVESTVLIIGGGGASVACAETLRQEGYKGNVILATKESCLPYDRTKLSKVLKSTPESLALRKGEFFSIYDIDVQVNKEAVSVDTMLKSVTFADGTNMNYDNLVVATGGKPRPLDVPGSDMENVLLLRSPRDANIIAEKGQSKNVVIVGNSFIGMEIAAYFSDKAKSVTVVGRSSVPFKSVLGERIGTALQKMSEEKGVKFIGGVSVTECVGDDGQLKEVVLSNGDRLQADVCIVGAGVTAATDFLKESGVEMNDHGFVIVNKFMKANKDNIYAAGDIASFPLFIAGDERVSIGHWQMAHAHGRIAALNIMDQDTEINSVPFFWSMLYGKSVRYCGYGAGFDDVVIHGEPNDLKFMAYYTKGNSVVAAATLNYSDEPLVPQVAELMAAGEIITKEDIQENAMGFQYRLPGHDSKL